MLNLDILDLNIDYNILLYIGVVIIMAVTVAGLKTKYGKKIGVLVFRFILGACIIYGVNFVGKFVSFSIPFNIITALIVGLLELPGFFLIIILKYVIYI